MKQDSVLFRFARYAHAAWFCLFYMMLLTVRLSGKGSNVSEILVCGVLVMVAILTGAPIRLLRQRGVRIEILERWRGKRLLTYQGVGVGWKNWWARKWIIVEAFILLWGQPTMGIIHFALCWPILHWDHPNRREVKRLLKGKPPRSACRYVLLHNGAGEYYSSFSELPDRHVARDWCILDWDRDVMGCKYRRPGAEEGLKQRASYLVWLEPAQTPERARQRLTELWPELRLAAAASPGTVLAVFFVTPEPFEVELPQELGYMAQLKLGTVRSVRELPVIDLADERYSGSGKLDPFWQILTGQGQSLLVRDADTVRQACLDIYSSCAYEFVLRLSEKGGGPAAWDEILREFYRGLLISDACLTSLMALMDYMDLILRLCLYTILSLRGKGSLEREIVPDDFAELGRDMMLYTQPEDVIWEKLRTQRVPCQLPEVLRSMEEILHIRLTGTEYSFQGLCGLLYYVRNKTRGHGSIRKENQSVLWAFGVEASLALSRFLCLDRFTFRTEGKRVLAGWDGALTDLSPMAYAEKDYPVLAFDIRGQGRELFIDYFNGDLITPSLN